MAAKRARFKVEELTEEKPEVKLDESSDKPLEDEKPSLDMTVEEVQGTEPKEEISKETATPEPDIEVKQTTPKMEEDTKNWLKDVKPDTTKEVEKSSPFNTKVVLFFVVLLLILGALVGGFYYYNQNVAKEPKNEETIAPAVTVMPTSQEENKEEVAEEVKLSELKVQVLNGSGKVGEAGVVKQALVQAGFASSNISTGNADSYDFEDIEVSVKEGSPKGVFDKIKEALGDNYELTQTDNLADDSDYDVVVTVGKSS